MDDNSAKTNDISQMCKELDAIYVDAFTLFSAEVDAACSQCWKEDAVERLLDRMLDFCASPQILLLFRRICRHYWSRYPDLIAFQIHFYQELYGANPDLQNGMDERMQDDGEGCLTDSLRGILKGQYTDKDVQGIRSAKWGVSQILCKQQIAVQNRKICKGGSGPDRCRLDCRITPAETDVKGGEAVHFTLDIRDRWCYPGIRSAKNRDSCAWITRQS